MICLIRSCAISLLHISSTAGDMPAALSAPMGIRLARFLTRFALGCFPPSYPSLRVAHEASAKVLALAAMLGATRPPLLDVLTISLSVAASKSSTSCNHVVPLNLPRVATPRAHLTLDQYHRKGSATDGGRPANLLTGIGAVNSIELASSPILWSHSYPGKRLLSHSSSCSVCSSDSCAPAPSRVPSASSPGKARSISIIIATSCASCSCFLRIRSHSTAMYILCVSIA